MRQSGDPRGHDALDRRRFVQRVVQAGAFGAAAFAAGAMGDRGEAEAAIVDDTDPRLATGRTTFTGATGEVAAYLAVPVDSFGPLPAVAVFHQDCGLHGHIEDVTRRIALAGFVAIAPDFLSPHGGTPASVAAARRLIAEPDADATIGDAVATIRYLEQHPATNGRVGVTGFCWGGDLTHRTAVAVPELGSAVPWHGLPPPVENAASVQSPLMMHHAAHDPRTEAAVMDYAAALEVAGVPHTLFFYEGVDTAFQDDTKAASYDATAAALAWQRTIDFFKLELAG